MGFKMQKDEENVALLYDETPISPTHGMDHKFQAMWHIIFAYTMCLVLATALFVLWIEVETRDPSQGIYSPANEAIEYESQVFMPGVGSQLSQYQGYPNDAMDNAWNDLYSGTRIPSLSLNSKGDANMSDCRRCQVTYS